MCEPSTNRRARLVTVSLAAALAVGVPAAAAQDELPYTAVPVDRADWAYTGAWGMVFVSKTGDAGDVALRLPDPKTRGFTLYVPSAKFVASGQIKPRGSVNTYKGWVYALTWSEKPEGAPDAIFVSDEENKGSHENYPVCFHFKDQGGWEFGFNWARTKVERRMKMGGASFKGPDGT